MSFLSPKVKAPVTPAIPPPPPAPPIKAVGAGQEAKAKEQVRRKKGVSSTILTGPRGLLPEQMPVTSPGLLGGS